jgi:hypothetical protein
MGGDSFGVMQAAYDKLVEFQLHAQPFQTEESKARAQSSYRAHQARIARATAEAHEEWSTLWHETSNLGKQVLALHNPVSGYDSPVCEHCKFENQYGDAEGTDWPCPSYAAVRDTNGL